MRRALALIAFPPTLAAQTPTRTAVVHGRVVADDTGTPIRNARLVLADDSASVPVLTDDEGRFTLPKAPPDEKNITATKASYAKATSPIADGMEVRLLRGGAISGRLTDDLGEPLPFRLVEAGRLVPADGGRLRFDSSATAETDDRGEYRIFGLPAGEFVLALAGGRNFAGNGAPIRAGNIPPHDFYPNAATPEEAKPVAVRPGTEATHIDFTVALPPASMRAQLIRPPAPPRPGVNGAIRGRITSADGRPQRAVQVIVSSPDRSIQPAMTLTDDDGAFEVRGLRPGPYHVAATSLSNQTDVFGKDGRRADTVMVENAVVDHVDISMKRSSAISGRILDENGDPLASVSVRATQVGWAAGRRRLIVPPASVLRTTDDLGRFRIFGLRPGRYFVSAFAGQTIAGWPDSADLPGYSRTFYPSALTPDEAQAIDVTADREAVDVDISVVRGHTSQIAGRVVTATAEPIDALIWLSNSYRSNAIALPAVSTRAHTDGTFEFADLAAGEYVLQAATSRLGRATEGQFAAQFVTLDGTDATNVALPMTAGSEVTGRVSFEGADPPEPEDVQLFALPTDPDLVSMANNPVARAEIAEDWTFEMGGLNGPRVFRLGKPPEGWTLKSVFVNGIESTDTAVTFGTTDQSLRGVEVVLTRQLSGVSGTVTDSRGRPATDGVVIAFAADRTEWRRVSRFIGQALLRNGPFAIELPPGSYYVVALDTPEVFWANRDWENPEFLESLVAGATRVTLSEGQRAAISLKLVATPFSPRP